MANIDLDDLIGQSYLTTPNEDGTRRQLTVIERLADMDNACQNNPDVIRFRATTDDESISEIIAHNQLLDKIECDDGENKEWRFKAIVDHQGPLTSNHKEYKGSRWNVQIHWENGEISWEPLSIIIKSDPVTCAIYGKDNDLLHLEG